MSRSRSIDPSQKRAQIYNDLQLRKSVPTRHRFTLFRKTEDLCAYCGKTRKEHTT